MSDSSDPAAEATARPEPGFLERVRNRDHTRGNLLKSLTVLALPLLGSSLFAGVIFQLVDLKLIAGLGADAITAVVVTNQSLRQIFFMMIMGGSFGAQALIARAIGMGNREAADHIAGQVMLLGGLLSVGVALLGILFPGEMLSLMKVSDRVLEIGTPYVRLVFVLHFGFVFVFLTNAVLNGAGDTTTPFMITILQAFIGLFAEWVLIYGKFGAPALGVKGVALGLACGQTVSILLLMRVVTSGASRIHLRRRHMRPDWRVLKQILTLAWPPALQMIGGFLVTVIFIRVMGGFGDKAQAAYSIGLRLAMVGPMLGLPIASACATLVGQNLGARNVRRAWRSVWVGLAVHGSLMLSIAAGLFFFRVPLLGAFTEDPEVIAIGSEMLAYQAASLTMMSVYLVVFRTLQGAGDVIFPMAISLANSLLLTLPLGLYLAHTRELGPSGVFIAGLAGAITITLVSSVWMSTGRWTHKRTWEALRTDDGATDA
ncbi:MAG: MATE family efflux transporter [Deltaproteobacteria bacterium]|nr:MATE family efflux transporter [Deltaproteobacteria bacterium]MBW2418553.1 MATE family efflux transporter [Deltaproteobacteria bacterium]